MSEAADSRAGYRELRPGVAHRPVQRHGKPNPDGKVTGLAVDRPNPDRDRIVRTPSVTGMQPVSEHSLGAPTPCTARRRLQREVIVVPRKTCERVLR